MSSPAESVVQATSGAHEGASLRPSREKLRARAKLAPGIGVAKLSALVAMPRRGRDEQAEAEADAEFEAYGESRRAETAARAEGAFAEDAYPEAHVLTDGSEPHDLALSAARMLDLPALAISLENAGGAPAPTDVILWPSSERRHGPGSTIWSLPIVPSSRAGQSST